MCQFYFNHNILTVQYFIKSKTYRLFSMPLKPQYINCSVFNN